MQKISGIFFDFDGVLSKDRFFQTMFGDYPFLKDIILSTIFNSPQKYGDKWMRGEINTENIIKVLSSASKIPETVLKEGLTSSLKAFQIESRLLELAKTFQKKGMKVAMVTNNMDIFNQVTIPYHHLDQYFPIIVNSSDYGCMKHEKDGYLFDIALQKLGTDKISEFLLIDDSEKACNSFLSKGGQIYKYTDYESFAGYLNDSNNSISQI